MSLITEADAERIERAVRELEQKSATELVVAVVPRSAGYWRQRVVVSVVWALAAAVAVFHFLPDENPLWALLAEVLVGVVVFVLLGVGPLARLLVSKAEAEAAVDLRALEIFAARGLHRTRDRTGMLILISELEHRVEILGDTGIHERVGTAGWQEHVDLVVAAIRRGEAATGVLEVIERLGRAHAELLPARKDDVNELPDDLVRR